MWHDLKFYVRQKDCKTIEQLNYRVQKFFRYKITAQKKEIYITRIIKVI